MKFSKNLKFEGSGATQILRDQHRDTVSLCEAFMASKITLRELLDHVDYSISVHFVLEDTILIPAFAPYLSEFLGFDDPIRVVSGEHVSIKRMYEMLLRPVTFEETDGINTEREKREKATLITRTLLQHVFREENGLFELVERYMPDRDKKETALALAEEKKSLESRFRSGGR